MASLSEDPGSVVFREPALRRGAASTQASSSRSRQGRGFVRPAHIPIVVVANSPRICSRHCRDGNRRMAQASPLTNGLKRRRNPSTGGADVLRLDLDRRIVGDVPLIDSVVMKLDREPRFRRYGQLGRMEDVEAGADAAMASRAKHIAR
jgi:hypothetical protein